MIGGAGHVALRVMTRADIPDGLRLSGAAGWNQRESDWRFLLEGNPERFVVAVRDGRVIGSGGAVCYGTSLAWVCMILVDPSERGHGIGTRIVSGVLESLSDMRSVGLDATPFGLGASVFTRDTDRGREVARRIDSGMVFINQPAWTAPEIPFGGVKNSGFGRELSDLGFGEFVNRKLVNVAPAGAPPWGPVPA